MADEQSGAPPPDSGAPATTDSVASPPTDAPPAPPASEPAPDIPTVLKNPPSASESEGKATGCIVMMAFIAVMVFEGAGAGAAANPSKLPGIVGVSPQAAVDT
ncbi:MAG: hypothetical protein WAT58_00015, partial [Candidatus Dormiibacterota bacterium]